MVDDPSDAGTARNIQTIEALTRQPYDASKGPPIAGPLTLKSNQAWQIANATQLKGGEAFGTKTGEKAANALYFGGLVDDPSPAGTQTNIRMIEGITGAPYDASKGPPIAGPLTLRANQDWMVANAGRIKGSETGGAAANTPINPSDPRIFPPPGGFVSTAPAAPVVGPSTSAPPSAANPSPAPVSASAPAPAPIAAPPTVTRSSVPAGATPDPNRPGWFWQGGTLKAPVTTSGPAGTIIGYDPNDLTVAKAASDNAAETLNGAYSAGGESMAKLKTITSQIRALETVSRTGGPWGQFTAGPMRDLLDRAGLANITTAQQAQTLEMALLKNELPSAIKSAGMTRVAQPEIAAVSAMTGTANLPPGVLNGILANVDNGVDYTLQRKALAGQVLGYDQQNPLNYPDFQQQDANLLNNYQANAEKYRASYGAIGANAAASGPNNQSPVSPTAPAVNPFEAFWGGLAHVLGWGSQPSSAAPAAPSAPAPQTQPNSIELKPDANGNYPSAPGGQ